MITGSNPDANFDYELAKHIKTIKDEINAIAKGSQNKIDFLTKNSKGSSSILGGLKQIKQQLTSFAENPEIIVAKLDELNSIMVNLSNWYKVLQNVGLSIDCFWLSPQDYKVPNIKSNLFDILKLTFINVFLSYFKDYNNVDKISIGKTNNIEVWTSSGIEWADILRRMIDEDFTQKTGTTVKLNILPAGQVSAGSINALMLSVINGKAPDVVLGLDAGSPTEFAMRNVVYDLTQFKDYNDVSKRFTPNIMEAFKYKKGIYALPSTMDFKVMFYRVDILSKYKIKIPETWNELYENVLPILYDNKLSCWVPMDYSMFLFQNGGTFYTKDYLKSALDTPEAYKSFKQMLDLFIRYGVPVSTNFFNRFRTGEIPIGISTMADYMKLQVGAPELAGRWAIAQVPGTLKDDGTIDRSVGSLAGQTSILINQSKNKDKAWEFLKWWTSEAIQTKYGHNLEANLGTAARWNSANIKSFKSQNWRKKDLAVIEECWQWEHEIQGVPGGYYTGRNISNAWNRIIVGNQAMTIRDSLEQAVKDINKEMKLKQKEYNYTKNNSN
jgi:ABC-type glycerol-3-phosphate transport system substrate-binding protein